MIRLAPKGWSIRSLNRIFRNFSRIEFTKTIELKLQGIKSQHKLLATKLESVDLSVNELTQISKKYANLEKSVSVIRERDAILKSISELKHELVKENNGLKGSSSAEESKEMIQMIKEELALNESSLVEVEERIIKMLLPRDEADDRGVILEVRAGTVLYVYDSHFQGLLLYDSIAFITYTTVCILLIGTGGDEASLFASEVFKMYQKYATLMNWKWEELSLSKTDIGGFKEAQANINGESVFRKLKFENGVHRVQRVPVNSKVIQTSAASVLVLPEAEEIDVSIRPQDLRIDVFRAGGAGGQSVNKTESAVRITHIPTGITVSMQVYSSFSRGLLVFPKQPFPYSYLG